MTPVEAAKAAKQLVGSYAHMKPSDPEIFAASVTAVLAQYPRGLVHECVDPRTGIARTLKFLSIAELVEWLDKRQEHYRILASHIPRLPPPPTPVFSEEHKATMRERIAELFRRIAHRPDPIDRLRREHHARSLLPEPDPQP